MEHYTVAIIGGGPGGYVAAIRLQQYGINTVVFERGRLGGCCLNVGCIPTKAMVKVAELYGEMKEAKAYGLKAEAVAIDYPAIYERKNQVVEKLVSGVEFMFKKRQIPVIKEMVQEIKKCRQGWQVNSSGISVTADYVILGTGSEAKELPFMKFDGETILSSTDILELKELPKSLAVIGGGVIGCEFASVFAELGTEVTIVEFLPDLISLEDKEISKRLLMALKKRKIKVLLKTGVQAYQKTPEGQARLTLSDGSEMLSEKVLLSVGRGPKLGIEIADLTKERGAVIIDDFFRTSQPKMFAIGDVTAKMMLAHTASKQGLMVAEIIKCELQNTNYQAEPLVYANIPRCTFTNPEVASVGLTQEEAEAGREIGVGRFPFAANGRSLSMNNQFGFVKVIAAKHTDEILGIHIIGPYASELIAQGAILINRKAKAREVEKIVFAHPTLSEVIPEAFEDLHQMAIHAV